MFLVAADQTPCAAIGPIAAVAVVRSNLVVVDAQEMQETAAYTMQQGIPFPNS